MPSGTYVEYSDDLEAPQPDEEKLIDEIVSAMARTNQAAYEKYRHGVRDAHAKSHGVLRGELTVYDHPDEHLRQGLFATPATYPVIARISTAFGERRSDQIHFARGIAVKVLGVPGAKALADDHSTSQDFLFVNSPTISFGHVQAYHKAMGPTAIQAKLPDVAIKGAGVFARAVSRVLKLVGVAAPTPIKVFGGPNNHILGETFHTMAALRYGNYVAKLSLAPLSESVTALADQPVTESGDDALRRLIVDFFAGNSAEYELRAQLCTDVTTMPIEDASVLWPDKASPHQPIAKLTFAAQDAYSPARSVYADDVLSFNPWHALAAHRPLGSIMRVRIKAYEASTAFRHQKNNVQRVEPATIAELPD